jgi:hypothetical protein
MKLIQKLRKLNNQLQVLSNFIGCRNYSELDYKALWLQSGITITDMAELIGRSYERTRMIYYGDRVGRKIKITIIRAIENTPRCSTS